MTTKLNIGCGPVQPAGWVNVDASNRAWLASRFQWFDRLCVGFGVLRPTEFGRQTFYCDLEKEWPWSDGSVDAVYGGEVLEHFTCPVGEFVLRQSFRVLRAGGVVRIRVPDNARFWRNYLTEFDAMHGKPRTEWSQDHARWIQMFFRDICVSRPWLKSVGHFHKWLYDEVSLVTTLERIGFQSVDRRLFHDSRIESIAQVEVRDDLIIEGVKPI